MQSTARITFPSGSTVAAANAGLHMQSIASTHRQMPSGYEVAAAGSGILPYKVCAVNNQAEQTVGRLSGSRQRDPAIEGLRCQQSG